MEAMCDWRSRYGRLPSSYDWSRTHARRRGGAALKRLDAGSWPPPAVVSALFGTWANARDAAASDRQGRTTADGTADRPGNT